MRSLSFLHRKQKVSVRSIMTSLAKILSLQATTIQRLIPSLSPLETQIPPALFKLLECKAEEGEVVVGQVPCGGAVMRVRPDGCQVEVVG